VLKGKLGIKAKMVLSIALALVVAFSAVGAIILSSSTSALNDVNYEQAAAKAGELVGRVRVNLEKAVSCASSLAEDFGVLVESDNADRELVRKMVYEALDGSQTIYKGVFTLWEANAFDGMDSTYAGSEGTDSTGRLMYWYYISGGSCKLKTYSSSAVIEYDSYYSDTKRTMSNVQSEPYYTSIDGESVMCVAITSPIIVNGQFLGIVGYEVTPASFQSTVDSMVADGFDVALLSYEGTYAATTDQSRVMSSTDLSSELISAMEAGNTYEVKTEDEYRIYSPYTLTGTSTPWNVNVGVPLTSEKASGVMVQGLAVFALSLALMLVLIWFIAGSIVKPIKKLVGHADSMANGCMDFNIDIHSKDETRQLADSFKNVQKSVQKMVGDVNKTAEDILAGNLLNRADVSVYAGDYGKIMGELNRIMDGLNGLVKNIKESAANVASASQQISNGSQDLAQGSTEQAAAIEEINATVAEVVEQTRMNSERALMARDISEKIHTEAESGNEKMRQLLLALEEINTASSNISNIIKTIEDIAFQTNILALNASVEAARAGVHGKGFAVVAEEVKNLAMKSAEAAKETNNLINASVMKAKSGVNIGEDMRKSLSDMVEGINRTVEAISKITEDSTRQVEAIEQLNTGIEQISQVVQNNTATAEESASSSEEMSAQAELLNNMVAHFKVK
jgi:methyl-accepting chemotaxis protein